MSITTERRITTGRRDIEQNTTTHRGGTRPRRPAVRTQPTLERRRHVYLTSPQGRADRDTGTRMGDTCVVTEPERISWTATVVGIIATAVVLLAFVAVANLRAESIDTSQLSAPQAAVVQAAVVPAAHVQQGIDTASVMEGQTLFTPAVEQ